MLNVKRIREALEEECQRTIMLNYFFSEEIIYSITKPKRTIEPKVTANIDM